MPSRSTFFLILCLALIAGVLGWNYIAQPFESVGSDSTPTASASPSSADVDLELAQLSSDQKISLLLAPPLTISSPASTSAQVEWVSQLQPGFVTLFGSQISSASARQTIDGLNERFAQSAEQPMILVDHEGGVVQRLNGAGFSDVPSWQSLCARPATASASILQQSARELKAAGVDIVLAPMIDVASSHAVLKTRVCSDEPEVIAEHASVFVDVFQKEGVLPVLKHFPGIGQTKRDLHTGFDRVTVKPEDALLYKFILNQHPGIGVMSSHVGVTNQYPDIPCSLSLDCIRELVSNYPQVIVFSDALEMRAASFVPEGQKALSLPEVAILAVKAGNTVLVFGPGVGEVQMAEVKTQLVERYASDELFKNQVDRSVKKILQLRKR